MRALFTFVRRVRGTARATTFEQQLDAEMQHHLALETEANIRRGLPPDAAREAARRSFGSVAVIKDECRDSWGVRAVEQVAQDLRFGLRHLLKNAGYTGIVLLTLSLGIGANTAIFSVVHAVLLRPLPYANGDRLVEIRQQALAAHLDDTNLSAKEVTDYRAQAAAFDAVVEYHQMSFNLLGPGGEASRVRTSVVSANYFDVLGVRPILGRTFVPADDAKDAPPVLVLTYRYWQQALGGDPRIVGRTFEMNDKVHTVIGVLPPIPDYPAETDVYMPVSACPFRSSPAMAGDRSMRMVSAIGRLRPGVAVARARGDVAVVAARMVADNPKDYEGAAAFGFTATALSLREEFTRHARQTLVALLITTGFVLLLVCANVANLTLARLIGRERELALRSALGAGRARIVRQLLTESVVLALGGGALGLLFAFLVRGLLVSFTAKMTERAAEVAIDPAVLAFTAALSILTALLFGIVPAWSRWGARGAAGTAPRTIGGGHRTRTALIAAQVAISVVLLIGAGLMVRSFIRLANMDAGFNADHVLTMRVNLDWVKYDTEAKRRAFYRALLDKTQAQPGIAQAAMALTVPLDERTNFNNDFVIDGRVLPNGQARPTADVRMVTPDYFRTLGTPVLRGRAFRDGDSDSAPLVAIVNLSMARHDFPGTDPIGHRVSFDKGRHWETIVGVVGDTREYGLNQAPADQIFLPLWQNGPLAAAVFVRTAGDPMAIAPAIQQAVRAIDPKQPISRIQTLEAIRSASLASPRLTTMLISLFAILALVVTAAGIVGVVAFTVRQRTAEIGIRIALGAAQAAVIRMIVRQALMPVVAGLALGLVAAVPVARAARPLLFEVRPTDLPTFGAVVALLAAVAVAAAFGPAARAAAVDPMQALRTE